MQRFPSEQTKACSDWPGSSLTLGLPGAGSGGAGGPSSQSTGAVGGATRDRATHLPELLQLLLELGHLSAGVGVGFFEMLNFFFLDQHLSVC